MNINSRFTPLFVVLALFALYLTIKWTCRLIFGLLDYVLLIGFFALLFGISSYRRLKGHNSKTQ